MIQYLTGTELCNLPSLRKSMLKDRKSQFVDRLGWPLKVSSGQYELDEYDRSDALYIICSDGADKHLGSMRLLPTNTANMIKDHFSNVIPGITFATEKVWECTRLCKSPHASLKVSVSVLSAAAKLMQELNLQAFLGVFDSRAQRTYRRLGATPMILGSKTIDSDPISVGLWQFDRTIYSHLVSSSMYASSEYDDMYQRSNNRQQLNESRELENA